MEEAIDEPFWTSNPYYVHFGLPLGRPIEALAWAGDSSEQGPEVLADRT